MLAVLSPGQGSQKPGFLTPWLDLPGAPARLRWWSALAGVDLVHLGTTAGADEIKDTARTQPLLVAAALLAAEHLPGGSPAGHRPGGLYDVAVVAGHSVGELAAASLAGALPAESAITLAAVRGREMAAACALEATGMAAVLGGDRLEVLAAIDSHGLHAANHNGAGQIVVAGAAGQLEKFAAQPPAGARVAVLQVAGAFHTPYMAPAEQALAAVAAGITPADPNRILLSNLDGAAVSHGRELLQRLVRQVTAPVRWDLCMRTLADLGVTGVLELPPAGTLAGLIKREFKGSDGPEIVTLKTPDDLPAARKLIARHGMAPRHEPTMPFRVVVSASAGTFEPAAGLAEGDPLSAGQLIGHVSTRQGPVEVAAHDNGVLTEWLAHHDDPVAPGQPLARISGTPL
ncbi:acyltransferase domain-containing protein [Micromonospora sp. NBC_01813]|uniref:acyltransferase domain-containing protein n=1 Tax=Micromonospora sp. NBC_01813 TaxID=2975988 RepID=UPI002DD86BEC|nr:acyltransferase domain-containing protein [Micromonospora sp. NBC_01813]WSA09436.1 acyltransferase domain-containing protein [Micromonospora sp. NBC_01813]